MAIGGAILKAILPGVSNVIGKVVKDRDLAQKLEHELSMHLISHSEKELEAAASVVIAEAQSQSWLTRNWRPMIMMLFGFIIANNYVIAPYAQLFFEASVVLETPPDLWDLMKIGIGGYVVSRGAEKTVKSWKEN